MPILPGSQPKKARPNNPLNQTVDRQGVGAPSMLPYFSTVSIFTPPISTTPINSQPANDIPNVSIAASNVVHTDHQDANVNASGTTITTMLSSLLTQRSGDPFATSSRENFRHQPDTVTSKYQVQFTFKYHDKDIQIFNESSIEKQLEAVAAAYIKSKLNLSQFYFIHFADDNFKQNAILKYHDGDKTLYILSKLNKDFDYFTILNNLGFTKLQILEIAKHHSAYKTIINIEAYYHELVKLGFKHDDIYQICIIEDAHQYIKTIIEYYFRMSKEEMPIALHLKPSMLMSVAVLTEPASRLKLLLKHHDKIKPLLQGGRLKMTIIHEALLSRQSRHVESKLIALQHDDKYKSSKVSSEFELRLETVSQTIDDMQSSPVPESRYNTNTTTYHHGMRYPSPAINQAYVPMPSSRPMQLLTPMPIAAMLHQHSYRANAVPSLVAHHFDIHGESQPRSAQEPMIIPNKRNIDHDQLSADGEKLSQNAEDQHFRFMIPTGAVSEKLNANNLVDVQESTQAMFTYKGKSIKSYDESIYLEPTELVQKSLLIKPLEYDNDIERQFNIQLRQFNLIVKKADGAYGLCLLTRFDYLTKLIRWGFKPDAIGAIIKSLSGYKTLVLLNHYYNDLLALGFSHNDIVAMSRKDLAYVMLAAILEYYKVMLINASSPSHVLEPLQLRDVVLNTTQPLIRLEYLVKKIQTYLPLLQSEKLSLSEIVGAMSARDMHQFNASMNEFDRRANKASDSKSSQKYKEVHDVYHNKRVRLRKNPIGQPNSENILPALGETARTPMIDQQTSIHAANQYPLADTYYSTVATPALLESSWELPIPSIPMPSEDDLSGQLVQTDNASMIETESGLLLSNIFHDLDKNPSHTSYTPTLFNVNKSTSQDGDDQHGIYTPPFLSK